MRRTRVDRTTARPGRELFAACAVLTIGLALSLAGCGDGSSASRATSRCEKPPRGIGPDADATLQDADAGRTVCLHKGDVLTVFLHAPTQVDRWSPITARPGGVLESRSSGVLTLPIGVSAAVFRAASPGTVRLRSTRPPCSPSTTGCDDAHQWSARVVVRG